jgi:GT2 family glycosyltransferase
MTRIPGRVSAIVTCFNREKYILPCLDSLLRQTYANLDIVIVDDCSTDGSVTNPQLAKDTPRPLGRANFCQTNRSGYALAGHPFEQLTPKAITAFP